MFLLVFLNMLDYVQLNKHARYIEIRNLIFLEIRTYEPNKKSRGWHIYVK